MDKLTGGYFPYCQYCEHDGECVLLHHEYVGAPAGGEVKEDKFRHEDLSVNHSGFQQAAGSDRCTCEGRICATESFFYPLMCECSTSIMSLTFGAMTNSGMCAKFSPNEKGEERIQMAEEAAEEKECEVHELGPEDLPDIDRDYDAAMTR